MFIIVYMYRMLHIYVSELCFTIKSGNLEILNSQKQQTAIFESESTND